MAAHQRTVDAVQASYRRIPAMTQLRLAKRTSNLFRPRTRTGAGVEVGDLDNVIAVDVQACTAEVQGMCTYERLVQVTLAHGLMPSVVPQLKTITLGGAVAGLGIESSSLRNGLPHESVLEMDILTGSGELVTASAEQHSDLYEAFPNSYGSLGYAVRLRIRLEPVSPYVALRHVRFRSIDQLTAAVDEVGRTGNWQGEQVHFIDGVVFTPAESYLSLGSWSTRGQPSDYTGQQIYYRSIRDRDRDCLTVHDYLWRWDTDWFWCSAAFGAQHPVLRRLWPRRYRRSDVYHRILGLENRYGIAAKLDSRLGRPARERVVQDVEVPLEQTAGFLAWFTDHVGMAPVWICPLRTRQSWPLYPLEPARTYVNVGFWGTVPIRPGLRDGDVNRAVEQAVSDFGGHKSLYSDVYYDPDTFDAMYGGETLRTVKKRYDPEDRLTGMYEKVVGSR
ncbi:MAG: FAD-linked oxidase [Pseudonocardiales bacterium]|nr:MAG: FAD-linked oxidase [Pseudonocardiales bacterium]